MYNDNCLAAPAREKGMKMVFLLTRPYDDDFNGTTVPLLAAKTCEARSRIRTASCGPCFWKDILRYKCSFLNETDAKLGITRKRAC